MNENFEFRMSEDFESDAGGEAGLQFNLPGATTRLRACLSCRIILSPQQFAQEGCPNCPDTDMMGDKQAVEQLTTRNYSGTAAIIDPSNSWVARNIKADKLVPGVYAIVVQGYVPEEEARDEYELE